MSAYVLRRLWQMIPTLAGVILLVFFLCFLNQCSRGGHPKKY